MSILAWFYLGYTTLALFGLVFAFVSFANRHRSIDLVAGVLFLLDLVLLLLPEMWIVNLMVPLGLTGKAGLVLASLLYRPSRWAVMTYGALVVLPLLLVLRPPRKA